MCYEDAIPGGMFSLYDMENANHVVVHGDWFSARLMKFLIENLPHMDSEHLARFRCAYPREVEFVLAMANRTHHDIIEARRQHNAVELRKQEGTDAV